MTLSQVKKNEEGKKGGGGGGGGNPTMARNSIGDLSTGVSRKFPKKKNNKIYKKITFKLSENNFVVKKKNQRSSMS